jgi:hypothetical protein
VTKQSGLGDQLYVDGYNLSGDIGSIQSIHGGNTPFDVTGIDVSANERIGGRRDGEISFTAFMNDSPGRAYPRFSTLPRADVLVTYLRGSGIGSPAASMAAKQIGYDPTRGADGALSWTVLAQANGYGLEWGEQLTAGIRTDTTATSPATGLDTTGSLSFGAQFYLQVFAVTGTSVTVTIQDSADNSSFANVSGAAFVAATGPGGQRLALANSATVRRYVRAITTGTFTNAQFVVQMTKNPTVGQVF